MYQRTLEPYLRNLALTYPIVTVTGPRQSGKTTLCRAVFPDKPYVNLEAPDIREYATRDPRGFLAGYPDGAVFDEIQRVPELPSYLQPIVDNRPVAGQYILTGSQQFEVMTSISQSLAGRTAIVKLLPLSIEEMREAGLPLDIDRLILNGFYPRLYDREIVSHQMFGDYVETYVERDIRQLVSVRDQGQFEKFIRLCAGRIGQLLNLQSLGNDVGISHTTARSWLTLLEASYVIFLLPPWFSNISKRQIKAPKLYFHDVGLAAYLLGAQSALHVNRHPLKGNLFENMVVMEALKYRFHRGQRSNLFFWRDARGNEVDLIVEKALETVPVEIKAGATVVDDFFKGLRYFGGKLPSPPSTMAVIYGGSERQRRSGASVWPATEASGLMREILAEP